MIGTRIKRALGAVIAVAAVAGGAIATSGPADAAALPGALRVTVASDVAVVSCSMTVSSFNRTNSTYNATLTSKIQPRSFAGYARNKVDFVECDVWDSDFANVLATASKGANGPSATITKHVVLPFDTSYELCGGGTTTTADGTSHPTDYNCAP